MVHRSRMEIRHGLSEQNRETLRVIEVRAQRKALKPADLGALAAFRLHATGEDLKRVRQILGEGSGA